MARTPATQRDWTWEEVRDLSGSKKRDRATMPAWLKVAVAGLAAAASVATAASQGNHDSGAVTSGPPSCVVITSR